MRRETIWSDREFKHWVQDVTDQRGRTGYNHGSGAVQDMARLDHGPAFYWCNLPLPEHRYADPIAKMAGYLPSGYRYRRTDR